MTEPRPGPDDVRTILDPPLATADLPGVGGRLRTRPEDFEVEEVPAYDLDGESGHVVFSLRKRGMTTDFALAELARHVGASPRVFGVAGLKDRHAVTRQWISAPAELRAGMEGFEHPDMSLEVVGQHRHKLRRGHLRGNRFTIVLRELAVPLDEAVARAEAKAAELRAEGLDNYFGRQRFGKDGGNLPRGLDALRGRRRLRKGDIVVSAGQSGLFNLYLALRRESETARRVLLGDVLKKTDTGGIFFSDDCLTDQHRLEAGEVCITGPIFGSKMRAPPEDSEAARCERQVLERCGVPPDALTALKRSAPGSRRPLWVPLPELGIRGTEDELGPGLRLDFFLPSGSYATRLCLELQGPEP